MNRALSFAFGLLMVAAGAVQSDGPALVAAAVAVVALVAGVVMRSVATLAVLATGAAFAMSQPTPVVVVLAGLAAVGYLGLRHSGGDGPGVSVPTLVGAIGFSAAAVLGAVVPEGLPWTPLAAPLVVVAIYVMVVKQYTD